MQRLLSRAVRDAAAVMKVMRRFAVAGLDQAARDGGSCTQLRRFPGARAISDLDALR